MSKYKDILQALNIDEKFTKVRHRNRPQEFNHVRDNIPLIEGYNYMADLLFLPAYKGYKYLFVIVDLASDEFDIEPIKDKTPQHVLKAMLACFSRKYVQLPKGSLRTDAGTEFKGVFHKFLFDHNVLQRVGLAGRHKQLGNVENLNKQLGRLINGYMNQKEVATGKVYKNWLPAVPIIREMLNAKRKKILPKNFKELFYKPFEGLQSKTVKEVIEDKKGKTIEKEKEIPYVLLPKYKVGTMVYYLSEVPLTILGKKQPTTNFREGDRRWSLNRHRIKQILSYSNPTQYRYILEGLPNVSFIESELKK